MILTLMLIEKIRSRLVSPRIRVVFWIQILFFFLRLYQGKIHLPLKAEVELFLVDKNSNKKNKLILKIHSSTLYSFCLLMGSYKVKRQNKKLSYLFSL